MFKRIEEDLKLLSHTNAAFKVFALTFQYLRSPTTNKSHKLRRNVTSHQIRVLSLSDFNQEKALVGALGGDLEGAFSVIVKTDGSFAALVRMCDTHRPLAGP